MKEQEHVRAVQTDPQGRLVIRTPAELTAVNLPELRSEVESALRENDLPDEWLVDAAATHFMDSAALGFLAGLKKNADWRHKKLKFQNFQPAVQRTLDITRMSRILGLT